MITLDMNLTVDNSVDKVAFGQHNIDIKMQTINEQFKDQKGIFKIDLGIKHHFSNGVYAKQMMIPKGHFVVSHAHAYDHLSILASGTVVVKTDKGTQVYFAPTCITIQKHVMHLITAVEDAHWFCIHATTETDSDKVDEVLIMKEEA